MPKCWWVGGKVEIFTLPDSFQFRDGGFGKADMELIAQQDVFIDTLFYFDIWEEANQQTSASDIQVNGSSTHETQQTKIWDPYNIDV
ncbi:hypothetical protein O181_016188 [Austropuccinia psidii MF-1]|uniref:Uncharacterized protein n=1 Tax=Austropuccinia psidii MF-1 TaxID=1389203 RepID=A0A9Q3C4N1_9BASI|nr:hypothetical protein [Austropuccinia psidii MF-1]